MGQFWEPERGAGGAGLCCKSVRRVRGAGLWVSWWEGEGGGASVGRARSLTRNQQAGDWNLGTSLFYFTEGLRKWMVQHGGDGWVVEENRTTVPGAPSQTCFVTSFR